MRVGDGVWRRGTQRAAVRGSPAWRGCGARGRGGTLWKQAEEAGLDAGGKPTAKQSCPRRSEGQRSPPRGHLCPRRPRPQAFRLPVALLFGPFSVLYPITALVTLPLSLPTPLRGPELLAARLGQQRVIPQKQVRKGPAPPACQACHAGKSDRGMGG